jgi:putative oxidoreductase
MKNFLLLSKSPGEELSSVALLFLRVAVGLLMITHGWGKLHNFEAMATAFPDPLGVGVKTSLMLAIGAEFFASVFVILGLLTRLSLIPLMFTMGMAFFVIHANDPLQTKELALVYLVTYIFLFIKGPGKLSLDNHILGKLFKN